MQSQIKIGDRFVEVSEDEKELLWDVLTAPRCYDFADWLDRQANKKEKEATELTLERQFEMAFGELQYAKAIRAVADMYRSGRKDLSGT